MTMPPISSMMRDAASAGHVERQRQAFAGRSAAGTARSSVCCSRFTGSPLMRRHLPGQHLRTDGGRDAQIAAQLADRPRVERAVGIGGRLRAAAAARGASGRDDVAGAPGAVVEAGLLPAEREAAGVHHLGRDRVTEEGVHLGRVLPIFRPGVALQRLPTGIADQPADLRAEVGLEHDHPSAAQRAARSRRHPEGTRLAVVDHEDGNRVLAGLQIGRQVEHVVGEAARLAADGAAIGLLPVDEQQIARVGGDARRNACRHLGQREGLAEEAARFRPLAIAVARAERETALRRRLDSRPNGHASGLPGSR